MIIPDLKLEWIAYPPPPTAPTSSPSIPSTHVLSDHKLTIQPTAHNTVLASELPTTAPLVPSSAHPSAIQPPTVHRGILSLLSSRVVVAEHVSEGPSLTPAPAQSSSSPSLKSVRIVDPRENNTYVDTTNESAGKVVAQEMYSDPDSPMSKNCLNASHTGRERGTEDSELLTDYKDERSSDDTGTHTLDAQPSPCLHVHISSPGTPPPLQSSTSGTEWTSQTSLSPASVHNMASFGSLDSSSIGASANANQYNTWSSVRSVSHDEYYAGEGGVQADSDSGKGAEEMSSFLVKRKHWI